MSKQNFKERNLKKLEEILMKNEVVLGPNSWVEIVQWFDSMFERVISTTILSNIELMQVRYPDLLEEHVKKELGRKLAEEILEFKKVEVEDHLVGSKIYHIRLLIAKE